MGQFCESRCHPFLRTTIGIDRMSSLKCKFIIGFSCVVTLVTSYLIVSEQGINAHLEDALVKSFSTQHMRDFADMLQSGFRLPESCAVRAWWTLLVAPRDKRLHSVSRLLRGWAAAQAWEGKWTLARDKRQAGLR